jgi:hypothetical protein
MSSWTSAGDGHEEHGFVDSAGVRIHYAAGAGTDRCW